MTNEKTLKALMDLDIATQALRQQLLRLGNVTNPFYVKLDGPQGKAKAWKRVFEGMTFDLELFNEALTEYKSNYICHTEDTDSHALACEDAEDCEYGYGNAEGLYEEECACVMKEL